MHTGSFVIRFALTCSVLLLSSVHLDAAEPHSSISPSPHALAVVKHVDHSDVDSLIVDPPVHDESSDPLMYSVLAPKRWKLLVAMLAVFTLLGGWTARRG